MTARSTQIGRRSVITIVGVVLGALILFGIAILAATYDDGGGTAREAAPSVVTGSPLPAGTGGGGLPAPEATGSALLTDGEVTVPVSGQPTIVLFLAHWCQHCQREVPVVQDWLDSGGLPETVAIRAVATGNDPTRPNFPPETWLEREGWTVPTLHDDGSVATAYGLDATPFWVFVSTDGEVLARASGALPVEELSAIATQMAAEGGNDG